MQLPGPVRLRAVSAYLHFYKCFYSNFHANSHSHSHLGTWEQETSGYLTEVPCTEGQATILPLGNCNNGTMYASVVITDTAIAVTRETYSDNICSGSRLSSVSSTLSRVCLSTNGVAASYSPTLADALPPAYPGLLLT